MPLLPGSSFATRYSIQARVKDGRLCREVPALDALGDEPVLLWLPRARLLPTRSAQELFVDEATRVRRLAMPGALPVLDAGIDGEHAYVSVPDLRQSLLRLTPQLEQGHPSPAAALALARQLAPILDGAHAVGLVHGYLCARDVMLLKGRVVLAGTGLWRMLDRAALAEALAGELGLSPEARHGLPTTPAADVYGLAMLCAQLTVGHAATEQGVPAALARLQPRVGLALGPALAERPEARPTRCMSVLAALEDALAFQPRARGTVPPAGGAERTTLANLIPPLVPRRAPSVPPIPTLAPVVAPADEDRPLDQDRDPSEVDTLREPGAPGALRVT